jgi:hypothetical protein
MALTRSQDDLADAVYRTADAVQFTAKHPRTYVNDLINRGLGALSRICRTTNPEFQPVASTTITTDGVATTYGLPSNFRSLISLIYTDGNHQKIWLQPYEWAEEAALSTPEVVQLATRAHAYKLIGSNIEFLPRPPGNHTALLWYATTVTQLTSPSAVMDTMERLDDYVIWYAAREIANERENWPRIQYLSGVMKDLEDDIRILARSIDLSAPARPIDVRFANRDRYGRPRRYWR